MFNIFVFSRKSNKNNKKQTRKSEKKKNNKNRKKTRSREGNSTFIDKSELITIDTLNTDDAEDEGKIKVILIRKLLNQCSPPLSCQSITITQP